MKNSNFKLGTISFSKPLTNADRQTTEANGQAITAQRR